MDGDSHGRSCMLNRIHKALNVCKDPFMRRIL